MQLKIDKNPATGTLPTPWEVSWCETLFRRWNSAKNFQQKIIEEKNKSSSWKSFEKNWEFVANLPLSLSLSIVPFNFSFRFAMIGQLLCQFLGHALNISPFSGTNIQTHQATTTTTTTTTSNCQDLSALVEFWVVVFLDGGFNENSFYLNVSFVCCKLLAKLFC